MSRGGHNFKDLTGREFGRLWVIGRLAVDGKRYARWQCICKCGNRKVVLGGNLLSGRTKSCGCLQTESRFIHARHTNRRRGERNLNWTGHGEISGSWWRNLQRNARERNLSVEITLGQAWELFLRQDRKCALTGLPLAFASRCSGDEQTASLDRIDNSRGYVPGNVRFLHKTMNEIKFDRSDEETLRFARLMVEHEDRKLSQMIGGQ
jgi:hypothetical protein